MSLSTDPHHLAHKTINLWLYNSDFANVYNELHPGRSSYTWSRLAENPLKNGDKNIKTTAWEKKCRIDNILLPPSLLTAVKKNRACELWKSSL